MPSFFIPIFFSCIFTIRGKPPFPPAPGILHPRSSAALSRLSLPVDVLVEGVAAGREPDTPPPAPRQPVSLWGPPPSSERMDILHPLHKTQPDLLFLI